MKIVLADNHDLIIDSISRLLMEKQLAQEVYKAQNGEAALELVIKHSPDLIISDYKMDGMNGLELLIKARNAEIKSKFLIISMINEHAIIETLIGQGVDGFINKESSRSEMLFGIMEVIRGEKYLCHITQETLKKAKNNSFSNPFLSRRELEVLELVTKEKKNREIAEGLHINVSTVETHKKNMIRKLGVKNTIGLLRYAIEHKLFE